MKAFILLFITTVFLYASLFDEAVKDLNNKKYLSAYDKFSKVALSQDNPIAQYNIALMNYKGLGIPVNKQLAFQWYEMAAQNGNMQAQNNLAHMYYLGNVVKKDKEKAIYWYKKSAKQNYALAQLNLGMIYERNHTKPSLKKSFKWYKEAALNGVIFAQNNLGRMYYFGQGTKKDLKRSFLLV